jgi:hypothetical protein
MEGESEKKREKARNMRREIEADAWKKPKEREEEDFVTNRKWGNKRGGWRVSPPQIPKNQEKLPKTLWR